MDLSIRTQRGAALAMVAATVLWGATFVVIRDSLGGLDAGSLVFLRFALAAGLIAAVVRSRRRPLDRAALAGGALSGVLTLGGYLFQAIGLNDTAAGTSAFLTSSGTLLAGLFAWPLLGQRPGRILAGGLALALVGCWMMVPRHEIHLGSGEAWTLLGAVSYALQIVVVARVAGRADPLVLAGTQALVVALALSPLAGEATGQLAALPAAGWWRLAYLAIAGSTLAPILQILAQRTLAPGRIGLLFALEPVFASIFAITLGGERFGGRWWMGAALILLAVWSVESRSSREPAASPAPSG